MDERRDSLVRCAIYTRKSTDENLELDFNSLDAQREAAEHYIASQRQAGWVCVPQAYDDGGFSGADTQRPALQRLLADVEAGEIDCILVYKIDRLSRSLMDFARIMQTLQQYNVSLVSVTQQFDTSTSMGRLSLHMLLSFAQFERDLVSERTRDKIASARRRGQWTGGPPVLGYDRQRDQKGSRLVVNPTEAEQVRKIFRMYMKQGSLLRLLQWLNGHGWRTKRYTTLAGQARGGRDFDKSTLQKMLTSRLYVGKITYNGQDYEGRHEAIVPEYLFARVQGLLRHNYGSGGTHQRNKHKALLKGLVRCKHCGRSMSHHFTTKAGRCYRYYLCVAAQKHGWASCPFPSLPAEPLEQFVVDQVRQLCQTPQQLQDRIGDTNRYLQMQIDDLKGLRAGQRHRLRRIDADLRQVLGVPQARQAADELVLLQDERAKTADVLASTNKQIVQLEQQKSRRCIGDLDTYDATWSQMPFEGKRRLVRLLVACIDYDGQSGELVVTYRPTRTGKTGDARPATPEGPTRHNPLFIKQHNDRRQRPAAHTDAPAEEDVCHVPRIRQMLAEARRFEAMLQAGTAGSRADLARLEHRSPARISQVMGLLRLAPDIQEAILSLPPVAGRRDPLNEHNMRPIIAEDSLLRQREMWTLLCARSRPCRTGCTPT